MNKIRVEVNDDYAYAHTAVGFDEDKTQLTFYYGCDVEKGGMWAFQVSIGDNILVTWSTIELESFTDTIPITVEEFLLIGMYKFIIENYEN